MDTSETYLKMCEAATEIQQDHAFMDGDVYAFLAADLTPRKKGWLGPRIWHEPWAMPVTFLWLPRQDQLQEMVPTGKNLEAFEVGHGNQIRYQLENFCRANTLSYTNQFESMEQLRLAFVMKELHQKVWSGTEWE